MTLRKCMPLFLLMFTVVCALLVATTAPGGAVVVPSAAFAQQEDEDDGDASFGEDLSSSTLSNVLEESGGGATAGDDDGTNTQIAVPMTDQDQRGANVGLNLALEEVTLECPPGFTLNNNGLCERTVTRDPECPPIGDFPSTFNPATGLCEASAPPACENKGQLNTETDKCVTSIDPDGIDPSCPAGGDFEYIPVTNLCEASTPPICEVGTFNPETDKCEQVQTLLPT